MPIIQVSLTPHTYSHYVSIQTTPVSIINNKQQTVAIIVASLWHELMTLDDLCIGQTCNTMVMMAPNPSLRNTFHYSFTEDV